MIVPENKLQETIKICEMHSHRMHFAFGKIKGIIPLDNKKYGNLTEDDHGSFDQLIFRYSKLQDSMGKKLFPAILENLGEDIENIPFIDLLNKLEKLELIEDQRQWLKLREVRNLVTHEYPFDTEEIVEGLNQLAGQVMILQNILDRLLRYIRDRFGI